MTSQLPVRATASGLFKAAPEKVFNAWLDIDMISKFMFGPSIREEEIVSLANEPTVGGHFSYIVKRNGQILNHQGEYLEIERPGRLVFTWSVEEDTAADQSQVIVEINAIIDGCEVTVIHEMPADAERFVEQAKKAWGFMLDKLVAALGE